MKIESVRIENFRGFDDETILFDDYTCMVGRNGSGKSTVLHALNVFFRQFRDTSTDLSRLCENDFHHKRTDSPIRITVTFCELSDAAKADLADYVRQERLTVTAEATFDCGTQRATVTQHGSRLGMDAFRPYFEADKSGAKASDLKSLFAQLRADFPGIAAASAKADMAAALHDYEVAHAAECSLIKSEDQFYGATRGSNRLDPHIQWVFIPAAKDYADEASESKDSAFGQLLARTVRSKTNFTHKVSGIREKLELEYRQMLDDEQHVLEELSESLETRLRSWAHPAVRARVAWEADASKAIRVESPAAGIRLGERGFDGELARFGHGLQRSYLLTLLQELTSLDTGSQPTLVMGIEEPELYQHPPQARHLAEVLVTLSSSGGAQVICCSHSPLFIPGDNVEAVRMVRDGGDPCRTTVTSASYSGLASRLKGAGEKLLQEQGLLAKLYPTLNPVINEMFFCNRVVLVEGIEDVAHISCYLELCDLASKFREKGCHLVPVGGKSGLLKPVAMAQELEIPVFVVWDADTDKTVQHEVEQHSRENRALQVLLGVPAPNEWPDHDFVGDGHWMWQTNLTNGVKASFGAAWDEAQQKAAARYGHASSLTKNPLAVAFAHEYAWSQGHRSSQLAELVRNIVAWAEGV